MHIELTQRPGSSNVYARLEQPAMDRLQGTSKVRLGLSPFDVQLRQTPQGMRAVLSPKQGRVRIPGQKVQLQLVEDDGRLTVGPVLAIFTSSQRNSPRRRYASLSGRFQRFIQHARKLGAIAYVFTPRGVNWKRRTITGYTWLGTNRGGRWVKGTFPFPNVVYNRVPTRKAERRKRVNDVRRRLLAERDLHLFNPKFLDKWQVYQILRNVEGVREYLPETRPYRRISELVPFLERHKHVYLKLAAGSLGNGTARVDLLDDGKFRWRATRQKGHIASRTLSGERALSERMRTLGKGRTYLMQQGIPLLRSNGRPFDVRALVQKETNGEWTITGMAARVAGPRQITTHRPRGGSRAKLVPLIRAAFPEGNRAQRVQEELERVILKAADSFDRETGRSHGELSMDVAIDQEGRPWILELNAKPAIFDEPAIRKHARHRLLNYCFWLGGFPPVGDLDDEAEEERSGMQETRFLAERPHN